MRSAGSRGVSLTIAGQPRSLFSNITHRADGLITSQSFWREPASGNQQIGFVNAVTATLRAYTYDGSGNTLSDGQYTYAYNAPGRLMQVSAGTTVLGTYT